MTEEQQRIAIAEMVGWSEIERANYCEFGGLRGLDPHGERKIVPSYTRNLNDMHNAELVVLTTAALEEKYAGELFNVVKRADEYPRIHATAAQRSEALLKTMKKWESS